MWGRCFARRVRRESCVILMCVLILNDRYTIYVAKTHKGSVLAFFKEQGYRRSTALSLVDHEAAAGGGVCRNAAAASRPARRDRRVLNDVGGESPRRRAPSFRSRPPFGRCRGPRGSSPSAVSYSALTSKSAPVRDATRRDATRRGATRRGATRRGASRPQTCPRVRSTRARP